MTQIRPNVDLIEATKNNYQNALEISRAYLYAQIELVKGLTDEDVERYFLEDVNGDQDTLLQGLIDNNGEAFFYLQNTDGEILGCIGMKRFKSEIEMKRLYLKPEHRSQGLAKSIIEYAESWATEQGYNEIYLDTFKGISAYYLYQSLGYQEIEPYNNGIADAFFKKVLSKYIKNA